MCGFLSCLSTLFHGSIFLSLCHYILSWWLWLCSIVWSQAGWFLQFHSFSRLLWLFKVFCISIQIVKLFVLALWKILLVAWQGLHWNYRLVWVIYSFSLCGLFHFFFRWWAFKLEHQVDFNWLSSRVYFFIHWQNKCKYRNCT